MLKAKALTFGLAGFSMLVLDLSLGPWALDFERAPLCKWPLGLASQLNPNNVRFDVPFAVPFELGGVGASALGPLIETGGAPV